MTHKLDIHTMYMIDENEARAVLKDEFPSLSPCYLSYFSWPQTFPNTAGPFSKPGMLVGQAFTTFQMECWTDGEFALIFSSGKFVRMIRCKEPFSVDWYTSQRKYA